MGRRWLTLGLSAVAPASLYLFFYFFQWLFVPQSHLHPFKGAVKYIRRESEELFSSGRYIIPVGYNIRLFFVVGDTGTVDITFYSFSEHSAKLDEVEAVLKQANEVTIWQSVQNLGPARIDADGKTIYTRWNWLWGNVLVLILVFGMFGLWWWSAIDYIYRFLKQGFTNKNQNKKTVFNLSRMRMR